MRSEVKKHLESRVLGNLHARFGVGVKVQSLAYTTRTIWASRPSKTPSSRRR